MCARRRLENAFDDDTESIITNERYAYITSIINGCVTRNGRKKMSVSDKIDRAVTNRWAALPVFAAVMFLVYYISVSTVGTVFTDWANDGVFGDGWTISISGGASDPAGEGIWVPGIPVLVESGLDAVGCSGWLKSLILDGIIGGVGAVLGFVPQMPVLFLFLAFLEACGYMATAAVATIMGLVAKEEVVGVFGVLELVSMIRVAAYSFLAFNLLCAPCFAAIGAIRREMNSARWTWFAIGYQCGIAYVVSLIIFRLGSLVHRQCQCARSDCGGVFDRGNLPAAVQT